MKTIVIMLLLVLSITGQTVSHKPVFGGLVLALIVVFSCLGIRLSLDSRRQWLIRRLSFLFGICSGLFVFVSLPFILIEARYARFQAWHSAGSEVRAGMTVAEARSRLERESFVSEQQADFKGVRFQVEPKGLARYKFEFPLSELYYFDVVVDTAGRVAGVKPWHD